MDLINCEFLKIYGMLNHTKYLDELQILKFPTINHLTKHILFEKSIINN